MFVIRCKLLAVAHYMGDRKTHPPTFGGPCEWQFGHAAEEPWSVFKFLELPIREEIEVHQMSHVTVGTHITDIEYLKFLNVS